MKVLCDPGYILSGDRILVCSSGSWSGHVGACVVEDGNNYIYAQENFLNCVQFTN